MEFQDFVDLVYDGIEDKGVSRKELEKAIRIIFSEIKECLEHNESVSIPKFGKFKSVLRKPRKGYNPKTKETINVLAQVVPTFKPYNDLRLSVRRRAPINLKKGRK